jgi:hypothetical protein
MNSRSVRWRHALGAYGLAACGCVLWAWYAGKDVNWDFLNYHLYLGRSAWMSRWETDFLPASIQSYLNPYAYVPLAAMISWGWRDVAVGSIMAALHAVNLLLVWLIACRLITPSLPAAQLLRCVAVGLAALSPVFLQQVGSSFADVTTATPCLLGYWLLLRIDCNAANRCEGMLWAGLAFGIAAGLKLTNAVFGAAAVAAVVLAGPSGLNPRGRAVTACGMGCVLGFLSVEGWWGFRVWQQFGNPFFPFLNEIFQSPHFPFITIHHYRFTQDSLWAAVSYPFSMASSRDGVYTEPPSPDLRPAVLMVLSLCMAAKALYMRMATTVTDVRTTAPGNRILLYAASIGYLLWLLQSANGRYLMPLLLLAGPLLVWIATQLTKNLRLQFYGLAILAVSQLAVVTIGAEHRWNREPWNSEWINVHVPSVLKLQPHLFVTVDAQSISAISAYVHPKAGFAFVAGQYGVERGKPGFDRFTKLADRYNGHIRLLVKTKVHDLRGWPLLPLQRYQAMLSRLGYQIDARDCPTVVLKEQIDSVAVYDHLSDRRGDAARLGIKAFWPPVEKWGGAYVFACRMVETTGSHLPAAPLPRIPAEDALDRVEAACPRLFSPKGPVSETSDTGLLRRYIETDMTLWAQDGQIFYRWLHEKVPVRIGQVGDWLQHRPPSIACVRRADRNITEKELQTVIDAFAK